MGAVIYLHSSRHGWLEVVVVNSGQVKADKSSTFSFDLGKTSPVEDVGHTTSRRNF